MNNRYIKIGLTLAALTMAFSGLMWVTLKESSEYYKHVDEVMADRSAWEGKSMQLHGFVVPGSISKKRGDSYEWKFKVQNKGHVVDASYKGIPPDNFQDEAEVVLKGRLTTAGFDTAPEGIMAKCPSKYEASRKVSYEAQKKVG